MNERIKELANECWEQHKWGPAWFDNEKFAKLIVNDVLNIVAISREQCNCSTLFRKISEHFGVEK